MLTVSLRAHRLLLPDECDHRAFPRRRAKGWAEYHSPGPGAGRPPRAKLLDISQSGAQLLVPDAVEAGDELEVELAAPGRRKLRRRAVVRWVVPAPDRQWRIGCEWEHRLSFAELTSFI